MKIGLYGYGRMGRTVERIAVKKGDQIVWKVDSKQAASLRADRIREADVVIEFSQPDAALQNIQKCLHAGVRVISGTTGWLQALPLVVELTHKQQLAFLQASNFSVGVNLYFAVNAYLSGLMSTQPAYHARIEETHHVHKKDAPSGTAITLAERVIEASNGQLTDWKLTPELLLDGPTLPIQAYREDEVPGTHTLHWTSPEDAITLTHVAKSRDGFGYGAWLAAHWIVDRKGVFTMADVLGFNRATD
ncbi:MAG: 4-hydroxy-tetrahydrodipicolinate reductase [Saprospiraceae bacterium]|nr:4-hydroxy-tetrahydrodipicolinate reductase [Saprospiraceae bacterium]